MYFSLTGFIVICLIYFSWMRINKFKEHVVDQFLQSVKKCISHFKWTCNDNKRYRFYWTLRIDHKHIWRSLLRYSNFGMSLNFSKIYLGKILEFCWCKNEIISLLSSSMILNLYIENDPTGFCLISERWETVFEFTLMVWSIYICIYVDFLTKYNN